MEKDWKKKLDHSKRQIISLESLLDAKQRFLTDLSTKLKDALQLPEEEKNANLQRLIQKIEINNQFYYNYSLLKLHFEEVHPNFFAQLLTENQALTDKDLRILSLIKLGLSNKEIAYMLNITHDGIKKAIQRIRKKMQLAKNESLRNYLRQY